MALKVKIINYRTNPLTGEVSVAWHLFEDTTGADKLEGTATAIVTATADPVTVLASLRTQVVIAAKVARQTALVEAQLEAVLGAPIDLT